MLFFFMGAVVSGIIEGGGGIYVTKLSADHTAIQTTLNVRNTSGFLKANYVQMGNEKVRYSNKTDTTFTGCTRGYDGTEAVEHSRGDKVFSPEADVINSALGFNVLSTGASVVAIDIPIILGRFFFITVPTLIMWDYSWLKEGWMQYVRILFQCISIGFFIYIALMIASALGILRRV